jgi:hypothetical protein
MRTPFDIANAWLTADGATHVDIDQALADSSDADLAADAAAAWELEHFSQADMEEAFARCRLSRAAMHAFWRS